MFYRLVKQMAECEAVAKQLKADNETEWIVRMDNIRSGSCEIVNAKWDICIVSAASGRNL